MVILEVIAGSFDDKYLGPLAQKGVWRRANFNPYKINFSSGERFGLKNISPVQTKRFWLCPCSRRWCYGYPRVSVLTYPVFIFSCWLFFEIGTGLFQAAWPIPFDSVLSVGRWERLQQGTLALSRSCLMLHLEEICYEHINLKGANDMAY